MVILESLFENLGLNRTNGLYITAENAWREAVAFPNRIKRLLDRRIEPNAFFCIDNKPLILFYENPANWKALHKEIWNFNECPIVIIAGNNKLEILNGFDLDKRTELLKKLGGAENLNDFTYFSLVTGRTWEQYSNQFKYENRIDYFLLENIRSARELLVTAHGLKGKIANAIIGKCIFVRYLIDRKVKMKFDDKLRTWTNDELCDLLNDPPKIQSFFNYLEDDDRGFNGDLFPLTDDDYSEISNADYQVLKRLLMGGEITSNQLSLFQLYDFSIIPIEFISNVYELFIGQANQRTDGAYYTPLFLVDYILKETVEKHLHSTELRAAAGRYSYCKVLDPACGSGIFLVETLRKIIEKYIAETGVDIKSKPFKTAIKNIAADNIYGVDKDLSAVQVAVFSIYLTLLDYLEPPGIETFKFPRLLNTNFFQADFFNEKSNFDSCCKQVSFDFIIGNPPWMRGSSDGKNALYLQYIKNRRKREKKKPGPHIVIGNKEIAQAFLLRSSDFSTAATKCALIVTSKVLYNVQSIDFRKYFLHNFFVERVFEMAAVRREVFDKSNQEAIAPACILFFRHAKGANTALNRIEHISLKPTRFFSLFKVLTISRTDFKKVQQSKLIEFDWLWKILVYGTYLDFNFIKRLKEDYACVKKYIGDEKRFAEGTGVQYSSNPTYDAQHLIGMPFIDARAVTYFYINPDKVSAFRQKKVHRIRDERLFNAPMLLIRKGLNMDSLNAYCAISDENAVVKDSITSIAAFSKKDKPVLQNIGALLLSDLFAYFAINTFSSVGIEREQTQSDEKYSLPYLELDISTDVADIGHASQKLNEAKKSFPYNDFEYKASEVELRTATQNINQKILHMLGTDDQENALIDFALTVNRPMIVGTELEKMKLFSTLEFRSPLLTEYASLFIERYKNVLGSDGYSFIVEIWYSKQIIGMFFKTIPTAQSSKNIIWVDKQDDQDGLFSFLIKTGSQKITDMLFIQKDIRAFEKNAFYVFKPNEKRLWHRAVGHIDVHEFADAMLKAGRDGQ